MWVAVAEHCGDYYVGILNVHPSGSYADRDFYLPPGAEIPFLPQYIVDIDHHIADRNAIKEVQEGTVSSAFGIGRTTATTWADRMISTGTKTINGSDGLMEALLPLQELVLQNTLLASVVSNRRRFKRSSVPVRLLIA